MSESIVIITGASSGIGEGFARALAARGSRILLVARRKDRLEKLCTELGDKAHFWTGDLGDPAVARQLVEHVAQQGWVVGGLINNAGFGRQAGLVRMAEADLDGMIQVNVSSLVRLTRLVLTGMLERRAGFVLNIASTAAFQPVPYFAVYAATKAFVVSFSEAVHEEVRGHGVHVGVLCPGPAATEFQQVAGMEPRFFARAQSVEGVVRAGLRQLDKRTAVSWTTPEQAIFSFGVRFLPRCWVRFIAARLMIWSGAR